ncbi:AAA family ATPase [Actinomycetospora lutea]|uniref:helix-turn-helix transcriptional regulator n=1 Tax=Actinomycetospora lutea TaxID=663604 RepID=UPI002365AD33|nr:LuxR family transcriptional regulator [Actinomycetospora lutea]MDD7942024.1 AAA family ATPase [Actinomycetospora lutea]
MRDDAELLDSVTAHKRRRGHDGCRRRPRSITVAGSNIAHTAVVPAVRCPRLIGRERELDAFRDALARARRGRGTALAVTGEPGIGKSRLIAEFAALATGPAPAMVGRAVEDGEPVAFRPLVEALLTGLRRAPSPELAALGPFRPALGWLLPQYRDDDDGPEPSLTVLAEAILRLLGFLAADGCAILVLEDLHWADRETLAVVEFVADNLTDSPVVLVLSARDETAPARGLIERLSTRRAVTPLDLGPLEGSSVQAMVAACLDAAPEPDLLDLVQRRAEGVPLLVEELVAAGARSGPSAVPTTVFELVRFRLAALPEPARRCVRMAAVLGEHVDATLLPDATGLPPSTVADGLRAAVETQLLELTSESALRFRHALTRDAVLKTLLTLERADLSRNALGAVEKAHPALEGHWLNLAAHLAAAAEDAPRAIGLMLDSGLRDINRGALASAEEMLRRARELARTDQVKALEIDEALTNVLIEAGIARPAVETATKVIEVLAADGTAGPQLAHAYLRRAKAWAVAGDWTAVSADVERARNSVPSDEPALSTSIDLVGALALIHRGEFDLAERETAEMLTRVEQSGAPEHLCEALELRGRLLRRNDLATAGVLFERQRRVAHVHDLPLWHLRALHELATIASLDDLDCTPILAARDAALRAGALAIAVDVDLHLTGTQLVRGELPEALKAADRCLQLATRLHLPTRFMASVLRAGVLTGMHRWPEAETLLDQLLQRPDCDSSALVEAWHVRAMHWLLTEQRENARTCLARAMEHVRKAGPTTSLPALGRWALLATIDGDETALDEAAATPGARTARWTRGLLSYAEAVRHGRAGRTEMAEEAFRSAEKAMTDPVPIPTFRHISRRLVAESALSDGWGQPTEWLRGDLLHFEDTGAVNVARACRTLLRQANAPIPRRTPGPPIPPAYRERGVTAREMEVLLLVRQGLTNGEIADRLVLSPRTVDKHLERLMAKTASASRHRLGEIDLNRRSANTGPPSSRDQH